MDDGGGLPWLLRDLCDLGFTVLTISMATEHLGRI